MPDVVDVLDLGDGHRLSITSEGTALSALPMVRDGGRWRRAAPHDGTSEALLDVLAQQSGSWTSGSFTVRSWTARRAVGERAIGVDQTDGRLRRIVDMEAAGTLAQDLRQAPDPNHR